MAIGIPPIGPSVGQVSAPALPGLTAGPQAPSGEGFGAKIAGAIENLEQTQAAADELATQAATGELQDVHDYMIASTAAQVTMELTVAVRNKAVEAFNEIMRMPV
ncbi:MAG TPA: flagellar hook-basal body complex protein FliE [Acidimicrobiia bacterium]|nr:flagellar hook-basal body complex protein FliE [Acidimicrobiia bacterium]